MRVDVRAVKFAIMCAATSLMLVAAPIASAISG